MGDASVINEYTNVLLMFICICENFVLISLFFETAFTKWLHVNFIPAQ